MYGKILIVLILFLVMVGIGLGDNYYADIKINVKDNGLVNINGDTNHPQLLKNATQGLTSKKGEYWLLNITLDEEFSSFIYRLNLPESTQLNYLKTPGLSRVEDTEEGLSIIGTGENKPFYVLVQYSIDYESKKQGLQYITYISVFVALLVIIAIIFIHMRKKTGQRPDYSKLTPRQQKIIIEIEKNKKPITQGVLKERTGLPKASLSRNINTLVAMGVVKKEVRGMTNVISIVSPGSGLFREK